MPAINDFKPFIPSNDYDESKAFYECIGFSINWDAGEVCEIDTNQGYRFLLLPQSQNNSAHSLMLHFDVDSADDWHQHLEGSGFVERFPGTKLARPKLEPWSLLMTYAWDPAGVLLHFAERPEPESETAPG